METALKRTIPEETSCEEVLSLRIEVLALREENARLRGGQNGKYTLTGERVQSTDSSQAVRDQAIALLESISDGFLALDQEWRYTFVNKTAENILALPRTELLGKSQWEVYPETIGTLLENEYRRAMRERVVVEFENYYASWRRWFSVRVYPAEDGGLSVYFQDITERKRTEERLKEQLRLTETITNNAAVSLFIMDERQECVFMNPAAEKLTGYTFEEVRGRTLHNVIHHTRPDGTPYPLSECVIDRAFPEGDQVQGEEVFVHKNGSFYPVTYTASPLREGTATNGTVIEVQDLTARKESEETLRQSENQFQTLAESIPQLSWMSNPDGHTFWYNRRWYEYTGKTPEEMEGWGWQSVHDKEMLPQALELWKESLATGRAFEMVFPLKRADGQFRLFLSRVEPVKDSEGNVVRWFGTNTDVDELKRAQDALKRHNNDLEQFAFAAAHDLQEPLRTVQSYTQLLSRRLGTKLEGDDCIFMGYILDGSRRMGELVKDLREYLEVATAESDEEMKRVSLRGALDKAVQNLQIAIRETDGTVTGDSLPAVVGKEVHFVQLFQNLLSNAIKYRRQGEPPQISVTAERRDTNWVISVKDNGIGIAPEYQEKVFGLFKRLHAKTVPGTGIGLAICQKIAERYGGNIRVESTIGEGSTFYFTVPVRGLSSE